MRRRVKVNKWYAGIAVDPRWDSFSSFLADMGDRPEGHTLERVDNTKGYSKDNCRWATMAEQGANKRNNRKTANGRVLVTMCATNGISYRAAMARLARGWDAELACSTPVRKMKPKSEWKSHA